MKLIFFQNGSAREGNRTLASELAVRCLYLYTMSIDNIVGEDGRSQRSAVKIVASVQLAGGKCTGSPIQARSKNSFATIKHQDCFINLFFVEITI